MPASSKKKKKPAANPARGFATTSVASKPKPDQDSDGVSTAPTTGASTPLKTPGKTSAADSDPARVAQPAQQDQPAEHLTPEELERRLDEGELQCIVDRFAAKSHRHVARHVAKVQTDCRLLRASATPVSWRGLWQEWLTLEVLALARAEMEAGRFKAVDREPERLPLREEDTIVRLWTLRQTLSALGFSEAAVDSASRHMLRYPAASDPSSLVWGLEECLDWLVATLDESELPVYNSSTGKPNQDSLLDNSDALHEIEHVSDAAGDRPSTVHSSSVLESSQQNVTAEEADESSVSDMDSDMEPDELLSKWLSTKTRLYERRPDLFENGGRTKSKKNKQNPTKPALAPTPGVKKLQQNLTRLESDILFDNYTAEEKWAGRRIEIAQQMAEQRRKELNSVRESEDAQKGSPESSPPPSTELSDKSSTEEPVEPEEDDNDDDDEDLTGGIFGESIEQAEVEAAEMSERATADTINVRLRTMPQWKGLSPRRVLDETCKARDSNARLAFKLVSVSAWSNRHSLTVSWSKSQSMSTALESFEVESLQNLKRLQFTMKKVACSSEQDSEAFVSTFALFQICSGSSKEDKLYLKLPPVWRDLYLEFAEQSKEQADAREREVVRKVRDLVREQAQLHEDEDLIHTQSFEARNMQRSRVRGEEKETIESNGVSADVQTHLQNMWSEKTSTPAYQTMLRARQMLPMAHFKSQCVEAVLSNQVTILCGETGCGKSTQMPAFILEHELLQGRPCKIYCTEPRRISAITLAQRVSQEMGEPKNACGTSRSLVGYAIRLESNVSSTTRLVFATTGIVLRMLESKDGFSDITHIVVDEVHERSIETDFLLIILQRLLTTRPTLKIVLMSATVDAERFSKYFGGAPVLNVPGRTFPVETRFLEDAIELTGYKIDGQDERVVDDDDDTAEDAKNSGDGASADQYVKDYSKTTRATLSKYNEYRIDFSLIANLIGAISTNRLYSETGYSRAILVFLPGLAEIRQMSDMLVGSEIGKFYDIHQLHSTIASEDQQLAFEYPPPGRGKIVLSTNIAETGVTIPDITCVIDTGKHKEMRFDERRQVSRLLETFISRANAKQRRGRAGRVQKGLCFHLFTKYRHDVVIAPQQTPEMLRLSLQDLIMRVKITKLGDIQTALSSALDPPVPKNVRRAIDALIEVGALTSGEDLTPLGLQISKLPLDPYLGKLVLYGAVFKSLEVALTIAAILTSKSPFVTPIGARKQADLSRTAFKKGDSDLLTDYNAYASWKRVCMEASMSEFQFCRKNMLSAQILSDIEDLKGQLLSALQATGLLSGFSIESHGSLSRGPRRSRKFVQVPTLLAGNSTLTSPLVSGIIAWALYPKILARDTNVKHSFRSIATNQAIALHPTSIPRLSPPSSPLVTSLVSYYSVVQSSKGAKNYNASGITPIHPLVLLLGPVGEAKFDGVAGAVILDGARLRLRLGEGTSSAWRVLTAVKILRRRIDECLRKQWTGSRGGAATGETLLGPRLSKWWALWERCVQDWEVDARTREERS